MPEEPKTRGNRLQAPWAPEAAFLLVAADFCWVLFLPHAWTLPARFTGAFLFTFALIAVWKAKPRHLGLTPGRTRDGLRASLFASAVALGLLGLALGVFLLLRAAGAGLALPEPSRATSVQRWQAAALTLLAYPILEEWIYRGILYPPLEKAVGRPAAVVLSGVVFQALHLTYGLAWPHYFVGGMILAWVFARSRSLIYPVLLHALWNLLVLLADLARSEGVLTL